MASTAGAGLLAALARRSDPRKGSVPSAGEVEGRLPRSTRCLPSTRTAGSALVSPMVTMPTLCLCAIVRNESQRVRRWLDAAKPILDAVAICDTGSTDDTVARIEQWGRENHVPTRVRSDPFVDCGHNRSRALNWARAAFPQADYLLLLDADQILQIEPGWAAQPLVSDAYWVRQRQACHDTWNLHLMRARLPWVAVGVTRAAWDCPAPYAVERLSTLWIDDRGDSRHLADTRERDKRLLLAAIRDPATPEPLLSRYYFYLAQTFRDLNDTQQALHWYQKRVERGGSAEETYMAQAEKARLTILAKAPHAVILAEHLKAFALRPTRAEALWQLAAYCRESQRYPLGYLFASLGKDMPMPDDMLFVRRDVHEWRLLDELAICAYWIGRYQESLEASQRLLAEARFPPLEQPRIEAYRDFARARLASARA